MFKSSNPSPLGVPVKSLNFVRFLAGIAVAASLVFCAKAQTQDVDDQYVHVLTTMQQGDLLKNAGDNNAALAKYREAQTELQAFRKAHAEWNPKVVTFRAGILTEKIAELTGETPAATTTTPGHTTSQPAQSAPKTAPTTAGQTVKLLDAGAEPKQALRLHPKAGDKQTLHVTVKYGVEMQMGETQVPPTKVPPMVMTLETTVKDVSADGDINYDVVIGEITIVDDPSANPMVVQAMKTAVAAMKGVSGTGTTSSRGINKKMDMKAPAGADPQAKQIMEQTIDSFANLRVALPEEAVGAGAKWEIRKPIKGQGLTINQVSAYELVSIENDRLNAKSTITQSAANQKIPNPAMPGGKLDLNKMSGTGTGEGSQDLAQLMPSSAKMEVHSELFMSGSVGAQKQTMTMKSDASIQLESK